MEFREISMISVLAVTFSRQLGARLRLNYHQALDRVALTTRPAEGAGRWPPGVVGSRSGSDSSPRLVIDSELARRMAMAELR